MSKMDPSGFPRANIEEMEELTFENTHHRARTCKAATLSAWVAFLTCTIVIFHALMSLLDSLIVNEKFWQQTEKVFTAYANSKMCENASRHDSE